MTTHPRMTAAPFYARLALMATSAAISAMIFWWLS